MSQTQTQQAEDRHQAAGKAVAEDHWGEPAIGPHDGGQHPCLGDGGPGPAPQISGRSRACRPQAQFLLDGCATTIVPPLHILHFLLNKLV